MAIDYKIDKKKYIYIYIKLKKRLHISIQTVVNNPIQA